MLLTAADESNAAGTVVVIVFLIAGVIYGFGYLRAVMHRANKDYKTTKAAVPTLRKAFWSAWWSAVKTGAVVLLIVVCLVMWMVRGGDNGADATTPQPSSSVSPSHRR